MLHFTNYSTMFTDSDIEECINMLNKKYRKMDVRIIFFKSKLQLIYKYLSSHSDCNLLDLPTFFSVLFNRNGGIHSITETKRGFKSIIYIFPFVYSEIKHINQLNIIRMLFHEIRHAYQATYKTEFYKENCNYLKLSDEKYLEQPIRRDATEFAKSIMLKNKDILDQLIGFTSWRFDK